MIGELTRNIEPLSNAFLLKLTGRPSLILKIVKPVSVTAMYRIILMIFTSHYLKFNSEEKSGPDVIHHLDVYYLGICHYETGDYEAGIETFDWAINLYSQFSDAQYYKALCLQRLGRIEEARKLYAIAKANGQDGYTINEDNAIYERYPYQVRWHNH